MRFYLLQKFNKSHTGMAEYLLSINHGHRQNYHNQTEFKLHLCTKYSKNSDQVNFQLKILYQHYLK